MRNGDDLCASVDSASIASHDDASESCERRPVSGSDDQGWCPLQRSADEGQRWFSGWPAAVWLAGPLRYGIVPQRKGGRRLAPRHQETSSASTAWTPRRRSFRVQRTRNDAGRPPSRWTGAALPRPAPRDAARRRETHETWGREIPCGTVRDTASSGRDSLAACRRALRDETRGALSLTSETRHGFPTPVFILAALSYPSNVYGSPCGSAPC